jgi:hypothetical protein
VEEVKIHTGSRVKLKRVEESALPQDFLARLRDYAAGDQSVEAIFLFALQSEGRDEQLSMAVAMKSGLFAKQDEGFLRVVDVIQVLLPEELPMNLYRFGASEFLARYCAHNVEPIFLRNPSWLEKQRKKLAKE